jgi:hypothetical protein
MNRFFNDISGKALLYAIPLFLTPFVDKCGDILLKGNWPSLPMIVLSAILGIIAAAIGLRAFFDGSYERKKADSDDGTAFPPKQTPPPASP